MSGRSKVNGLLRSVGAAGLVNTTLAKALGRLIDKAMKAVLYGLAFVALAVFGYLYNLTGSAKGAVMLLAVVVLTVVALVGIVRSGRRPHLPALPVRGQREPIPAWLRAEIIERDDSMCGICGFRVTNPADIHIDHIHPVHAGGTNDPANLQTSHSDCNQRKGGVVGWVPPYRRTA